MDPGAPYLFLSHTKVDKPRVRALADALQKRGMGAWLDEREMRVGDSIAAEVAARICGSVGVVLCVSPAAFASDWVQRELAFAAMKKVPVFPVELEPVTWPDAAQIYLAEVLRISVAAGEEDAAAASVLEQLRKRGSRVQGILHSNRVKLPAEPSPATLLNAQFEVVPFFEPVRRRELEILETWCSTAAPTSARLFIGPGGAGKTRLMMEWSRRRRDAGWAAGFLSKDASAEDVEAILRTTERTFVVIDYAESRRTSLEVLLKKASRRDAGPPLRIALLARNASDWWASLKAADVAIGTMLAAHLVEALAPVTIAEELRVPVFEHAGKAFGATTIAEVPALDDARFERVLYLHMAALAAVRGWPIDAGELLPDVVTHEIRFWGCDDEAAAARLVAAVTLRGRTAGRDLKTLDERVEGPGERRFRDVVVDLYGRPPEAGGPPEVGGLEPDLLGETIVARTLEERETPEDFLERIFAAADEAALEHAFTVLGRLDLRVREDVTPWLERFLAVDTVARALPAFRAAMTLGETTAESMLGAALARALGETEGAHDVAQAIDREVPEFTVSLRELAAWATARRVDDVVGNKQPEERARLLNNLGNRLDDLGRREDALAATEEAVALRRTLAEARPDAFLPNLATSLNNLGIRLDALGRREDALAATEEAVALYRTLAEARPDAFLPNLATSLNNLGIRLDALGRREDALAATEEAVALYRTLAEARPDAFLPDLAMSLTNLGVRLDALGRREDALAATEEAVALYRTLAEARPDAFLPDLAGSLNNLGAMLNALGRREDALAATKEAVALYRTLAEARPDAFLPNLAGSLNNLGIRLDALGQREDALAATEEAVALRRTLAEARPDAFLPDLAGSLNNLGVRLDALGRREDALAATEEAVALYRTLAEARPDAFLPNLAASLNNLGAMLDALGRREDALAATEEAVTLYRTLAETRPDAFLPDLAGSLNNLGIRLDALGRREDALAATEDAVALRRTLAEARPDAFLPDLAGSLNNLGIRLSNLGRHDEALVCSRESVAITIPFAEQLPRAFARDLRTRADNYAIDLQNTAGSTASDETLQRARALLARIDET